MLINPLDVAIVIILEDIVVSCVVRPLQEYHNVVPLLYFLYPLGDHVGVVLVLILEYRFGQGFVASHSCEPYIVQHCDRFVEPIKAILVYRISTLVEGEKSVLSLIEAMGHMLVSLIEVGDLLYKTRDTQQVYLHYCFRIYIVRFYLGPRFLGALSPDQGVD